MVWSLRLQPVDLVFRGSGAMLPRVKMPAYVSSLPHEWMPA